MTIEPQDSSTTWTACRILIFLDLVISLQAIPYPTSCALLPFSTSCALLPYSTSCALLPYSTSLALLSYSTSCNECLHSECTTNIIFFPCQSEWRCSLEKIVGMFLHMTIAYEGPLIRLLRSFACTIQSTYSAALCSAQLFCWANSLTIPLWVSWNLEICLSFNRGHVNGQWKIIP